MHHRVALLIKAYGVFEALARLDAFIHHGHVSSVQQLRVADEASSAVAEWLSMILISSTCLDSAG